MFSSKSFIVLHFAFRSVISFVNLDCVRYRSRFLRGCWEDDKWIANYSGTICWKDYDFSIDLAFYFGQKSFDHLYVGSISGLYS